MATGQYLLPRTVLIGPPVAYVQRVVFPLANLTASSKEEKHIIVRVGIVGEVPPLTVVDTLERNGKLNILLVNR